MDKDDIIVGRDETGAHFVRHGAREFRGTAESMAIHMGLMIEELNKQAVEIEQLKATITTFKNGNYITALEAARKACLDLFVSSHKTYEITRDPHDDGICTGADRCEEAIDQLIKEAK